MAQAVAEQLKQEGSYQVRSMCHMCLHHCGIIATVEDGIVVRVDGDPDNPHNLGKACAKGRAGFFTLDSPYRVTKPLKRTNPEKGPGVDPGWVPISWDEALDLVAEKLKQVQKEDCRKLWFISFDMVAPMQTPWALGFGTLVEPTGQFCGSAVHPITYLNQSAWLSVPDLPLTRYVLAEGAQYGALVCPNVINAACELGRNREKVKVVAVDPSAGHGGSIADEWIPIRPGTDAAFLLGLVNVLINELNIYDAPYLKNLTNAPYLVGVDGQYVRDPDTRKPLIWDTAAGVAKPFDASLGDPAILGSYRVREQQVRPAFQVLAEQVRKYTPEEVSRITSIPAVTVRRIAKEFGEAASIGSTITIDGEELPYRPASVVWYRGLSAHKHAYLNGMAAMLLQTIIGGLDVPGGLMGFEPFAYRATEDGLLTLSDRAGSRHHTNPYPPRTVTPPKSINLFELFPVAYQSRAFAVKTITEPEKYKNLALQPKMLLQRRSNMAFSGGGKGIVTEVFRKIPFIVSITSEIEETTEFADIVLPGLHYLEELQPLGRFNVYTGSKPGVYYGQKPVVKPPFDPPWDQMVNDGEILLELAKRAGFLDDVYAACNATWNLRPPYVLEPGKQYSYHELMDRLFKSTLGPDKGVDWYLKDGVIVKERSMKERYPGAYPKPRIHLYHEYMIDAGRQVDAMTRKLDLAWDPSDYIPLAEWRTCPAHTPKSPEFDLYLINAKAPYHSFTATGSNPLLNEVGDQMGYDRLVIHRDAAERKGIKDGDWVEVETDSGKKDRGRVKLTTSVHPEVTMVWGSAGRWAKAATQGGEPRGIHFNSLLTMDDEHMDFVTTSLDSCLRVKITKVEGN